MVIAMRSSTGAGTTTTTTTTTTTATLSSTIATEISWNNNNNSNNNSNKKMSPASPLRKSTPATNHHHHHHHTSTPNRSRVNSRDIPRSYAGLYGEENDLLPFELNRKQHTDWLESKLLLATYLGGILLFEIVVTALLDAHQHVVSMYWSWTITNAVHCLLSTIYLHWLKGSIFDEQGEMAAMTLWEQLEGRRKTQTVKRVLTIVPTLLCYAACHFAGYEGHVCILNIILWLIHVLGKLPVMNGRRIFGINRTTGIDDDTDDIVPLPVPVPVALFHNDNDNDTTTNTNSGGDGMPGKEKTI